MFSISDVAVRGGVTRSIPTAAREALDQGDLDTLFSLYNTGLVMMADPDDDADDDADDGDDADDDDPDDGDDDDAKKAAKVVDELKAENKRRRLKAARQDKEMKELRERLDKLQGKKPDDKDDKPDDKPDDDKAAEFERKLAEKDRQNEDLLIRLEFTSLVTDPKSKIKFKSPKTALRLLDLKEVTIGDDGEIEGLEDAIDALAKAEPYLLQDEDDGEDDDEEKDKPRRTGQPSGAGRRKKGQPNRDKLVAKYPALRR